VFTWQWIGYPRDVEPDAADPPGQPAERADERNGLRGLSGKDQAEESGPAAQLSSIGGTRRTADMPTPEPITLAADGSQAEAPQPTTVRMTKSAPAPQRKGPGLLGGNGAETPAAESPAQEPGRSRHNRALANSLNRPLTTRPLVNPHLRNDPRLRVWIIRALVAFMLLVGFTIGLNWRIGLTAAVIYIAADSVFRSKTSAVVPAGVRVTSAQRFTRRRLRVLQASGYMALHARRIPGTSHIIDHVVVGPAGVFTIDSQRLDRRLPLRAMGGMLYHGRESMEGRFDHAVHEAKHAAKLIATELGQRVRVRPAMVLYGPSISWVIMKVKGVDVFDGSRVGVYFRRETKAVARHRLNSSQIAMVLAAAARALPPLQ
jgi:Nuclease-related domain